MKKVCWAVLLAVVFAGCKPKIPDHIIQPQKIRAVLYDMHIIDGYITGIPNPDSAKKVSAAYYKGCYKKFGIDSASYARSMNYYFDHPESLSSIYKDVTERLKKSKDSIDKLEAKRIKKEEAKKKAKLDSLKKADPDYQKKLAAAEKVTRDSVEKVKMTALKKARKDSAGRAETISRKTAGHSAPPRTGKDSMENKRLGKAVKTSPATKLK